MTRQPLDSMRWRIGALLFASTIINYIDRQSLSVLAPYLKTEFNWTNENFARVVIAFRLAYALGQPLMGRLIDMLGTRNGLTLSVLWYSLIAVLTPMATGLWSLCGFRFLLGLGEAGNWPGAAKAVSERFPEKERGLAVALYDSGSAVGAALAPLLVLGLYSRFGGWRPAFVIPGLLGFIWVLVWRFATRRPVAGNEEFGDGPRTSWRQLLGVRQTWGLVLGRGLTDPVWFFITDWFAIYLVAKKIRLEEGILAFWIPFIAADIGNFLGGGVSGWLVRRGWNVLTARKVVIGVTGCGMSMIVLAIFTSDLYTLAALFSITTCCYAAWSTMALTLPADLYASKEVASVSGLTGAGSGLGTIASTLLIGSVTDRYSFEPVLLCASMLPLLATAAVLTLIPSRRVQH